MNTRRVCLSKFDLTGCNSFKIKNGYKMISNKKYFHRIVFFHYNPDVPGEYEVHHIDSDRSNNRLLNLFGLPKELHRHIHKIQNLNNKKFNRKELKNILEYYLRYGFNEPF